MADHGASGPAAGYLFQLERTLVRLLDGKTGDTVGIETLDDVTIVERDGGLVLEQDKHSLTDEGHPFTDRSRALWRALDVWLTQVAEKPDLIDRARFALVTNRPLPTCLASRIGATDTPEEAHQLFLDIVREAGKPRDSASDLIDRVVAASEDLVTKLVLRTECIDAGVGLAAQDARQYVIERLACPRGVAPTSVANELAGWIQQSVLGAWRSGTAAWIPRDSFANQFHAIIDQRKRERVRERSSRLLPQLHPAEVGQHRAHVFVQQAQLVNADEEDIDMAIRHYIQARDEKLRLSEDGDVTREDWLDFDRRLVERWELISKRIFRTSTVSGAEAIGRDVMSTTVEHREMLAGAPTTEYYLTAGSYHRLADVPQLGWHPQWRDYFPPGES